MKEKAFTLIELLAVIIILAVLMLIAIPAVSNYINESRKKTYVDTAKALIKGATNLVNSGDLDMTDTNTTYYIPYTCVNTETKSKSPYGDFEEAYVVVTYNKNDSYDYYFYSKDSTGVGIYPITEESALSAECIRSGIENISTNVGLGKRKNIKVYNSDCTSILEEKEATEKNQINKDPSKMATFIEGNDLNTKIKRLAGTGSETYYSANTNILDIKVSEDEPTDENKQESNIVSTSDSTTPIYMWFEEETGILYWWSEDDNPYLNENSHRAFSQLEKLNNFDSLSLFDTSKTKIFAAMFYGCKSLENLNLRYFDTSSATTFNQMFAECRKIVSLDLSSFDTTETENMRGMFWNCVLLESIDFSSFDTPKLLHIGSVANQTGNGRSSASMFEGCYSLKSLDLSNFNTSKIEHFAALFYGCHSLTELDLSSWNTSSMTDMYDMFYYCDNLERINFGNIDTSKVTNMAGLFDSCKKLNVDVSMFDTSNVIFMGSMFSRTPVTSLDLRNFNTSKVKSLFAIFWDCDKLTHVDVSSFDTSSVENFFGVFGFCSSLEVIDITNFNTVSATSVSEMFYYCRNLKTIYTGTQFIVNSNMSNSGMFTLCDKLVGENGTTFSSTMIDGIYAHYDGGTSNPGFFSHKV